MSESVDFETAFIVIGLADGTYIISTELEEAFTIARAATRLDVKRACRELYDKIVLEEIVTVLK